MKPRYLYELEAKLVAHADGGGCLTVQQANLINDDAPDSYIFLDRENAAALRDTLDKWLNETAEQAT